MIGLVTEGFDHRTIFLMKAALQRSFSSNCVQLIHKEQVFDPIFSTIVSINPSNNFAKILVKDNKINRKKIIILGHLPDVIKYDHEFNTISNEFINNELFHCNPAKKFQFAETEAKIIYTNLQSEIVGTKFSARPLCRYDFCDEWNNIGYGKITCDGSPWSISDFIKIETKNEVAVIKYNENHLITFSALFESEVKSILWINRPVGLVDSGEWLLIEKYISSWRSENIACEPMIHEVPCEYDSLISMRLDCDEDLASSQSLFEFYTSQNIPFSLAINCSILQDDANVTAAKKMIDQGIDILSHSSTHPINWGGSYDAAYLEALGSKNLLERLFNCSIDFAVSPFHHTPPYCLDALYDAGYKGLIGGIISSHPEFLWGRGGRATGIFGEFVGHSQQCMLHGDCLSTGVDNIHIYNEAYNFCRDTRTIFSYLDHPISTRYDYGWNNYQNQIDAHSKLIQHIKKTTQKPLFIGQLKLMNYLLNKSKIKIRNENGSITKEFSDVRFDRDLSPTIEYRNKLIHYNDLELVN